MRAEQPLPKNKRSSAGSIRGGSLSLAAPAGAAPFSPLPAGAGRYSAIHDETRSGTWIYMKSTIRMTGEPRASGSAAAGLLPAPQRLEQGLGRGSHEAELGACLEEEKALVQRAPDVIRGLCGPAG